MKAASPAGLVFLRFLAETFIEAASNQRMPGDTIHFPSFLEGLSLRRGNTTVILNCTRHFPSFSEGLSLRRGH